MLVAEKKRAKLIGRRQDQGVSIEGKGQGNLVVDSATMAPLKR